MDLNARPPAGQRFANGMMTSAPLKKGEQGMLVAEFPVGYSAQLDPLAEFPGGNVHHQHQFELPNLVLDGLLIKQAEQIDKKPAKKAEALAKGEAKPKAKAKAKPKGKAKAKAKAKAGASMPAPAVPAPARRYCVMYYKKNNSIGIRQKYGGKQQVFSFGGVKAIKGKADMQVIGVELASACTAGTIGYEDAKLAGQKKAEGKD